MIYLCCKRTLPPNLLLQSAKLKPLIYTKEKVEFSSPITPRTINRPILVNLKNLPHIQEASHGRGICQRYWYLITCLYRILAYYLSERASYACPISQGYCMGTRVLREKPYSKLEHSVCQSHHLILRFNQATKLTYNIQDYQSVTTRYYSWFGRSDGVGRC